MSKETGEGPDSCRRCTGNCLAKERTGDIEPLRMEPMPEQINSSLGQVDATERDRAPTKHSAQGHSLSHFLCLLFKLLDEDGTRYCVLHSWQGLPDELPSDLD